MVNSPRTVRKLCGSSSAAVPRSIGTGCAGTFALRVRRAGKVVSVPVLGVVGVLPDGHKHLLGLELCGGESFAAWKGCLDDLVVRGLRAPLLAIIDGNAGLRRAVELVWPQAAIQRCCVHKLRNLERKAPKHALAEVRDDFYRIVYFRCGAWTTTSGRDTSVLGTRHLWVVLTLAVLMVKS